MSEHTQVGTVVSFRGCDIITVSVLMLAKVLLCEFCNNHLGLCFGLCRLHLFGRVIVQLCIVVWEGSCLDL